MSARQQPLRIDVGNGAGRGDVHVPAHENCADGRASLKRFGLFFIAHRASAHHRNDAGGSELRRELANGFLGKSIKYERRVDGFQILRETLHRTGERSCVAGTGSFPRSVRNSGLDGSRFLGGRLVERVDLEHVGDGSNAGDRFLRELADAECDGAREFAIEVNGASAHSRDNAGIFHLRSVQAHEDDVALGPIHIAQYAEDFDVHRLRLDAFEDGVRNPSHACVDLAYGDRRLLGLGDRE